MKRVALVLAALLVAGIARAQPAPAQPGADRTTTHSLALPGRTLAFTATVSTIRLANPAGATVAEIVTTAFQLSGAPPGTRPVSHGFFVACQAEFSVLEPIANSSLLSLPSITAPSRQSCEVTVDS